MTSSEVAALLGLGTTTLRRIEGTVFGPALRIGARKIRVFSTDDVQRIREWCGSVLRRTPEPRREESLVPLGSVRESAQELSPEPARPRVVQDQLQATDARKETDTD
jgi:hypothetical protein